MGDSAQRARRPRGQVVSSLGPEGSAGYHDLMFWNRRATRACILPTLALGVFGVIGHAEADPGQNRRVELRQEASLGFSQAVMREFAFDESALASQLAWTRLTMSTPLSQSARESHGTASLGLLAQIDPRDAGSSGTPEVGGALASAFGSFFSRGLALRVAQTRLFGEHRHFLRGYVSRSAVKLVWRVKF